MVLSTHAASKVSPVSRSRCWQCRRGRRNASGGVARTGDLQLLPSSGGGSGGRRESWKSQHCQLQLHKQLVCLGNILAAHCLLQRSEGHGGPSNVSGGSHGRSLLDGGSQHTHNSLANGVVSGRILPGRTGMRM